MTFVSGEPLPADWYSSRELWQRELESVFADGPDYVGHVGALPADGCYIVVGADSDRILIRQAGSHTLVSNICGHRGALMLSGRGGPVAELSCPWHGWCYDLQGRQRRPPLPCTLKLPSWPTRQWKGLLFGPRHEVDDELAAADELGVPDTSHYVLDRIDTIVQPYNWKIFVEVFLDNYHIPFIHPGFRRFVSLVDVEESSRARLTQALSVQSVGPAKLSSSGSAAFRAWEASIRERNDGMLPDPAAIWLMYYPNLMIEWYPFTLIVNVFTPLSPEQTSVRSEFYYDMTIDDPETYVGHEKLSSDEVQAEDDQLIAALARGRRLAARSDQPLSGPYHAVLENGITHFHSWLRRAVARQ